MSLSDVSGNLADRLRKKREQEAAAKGVKADKPVDFKELYTLRARILGVLIQDARLARSYTVEDCADRLGIDAQTLLSWEYGRAHPSLPELELLAYELGVPISHFWNTKTLTGNNQARPVPHDEYLALRNRVVGALVKQARTDAGLTEQQLSEKSGIPVEQIQAYELGQAPVPLTELTSLASAANVSLQHFLENNNRVGHWIDLQENFHRFREMPDDMRAFISNPTNATFIELAIWFSSLGVDDLRGIAESILHLTRLEASKMKHIAEGILNDITL